MNFVLYALFFLFFVFSKLFFFILSNKKNVLTDKIKEQSNSSLQNFIEYKKDWKFYVAMVTGVTMAGTGVYLLSSNFKQRQYSSRRSGSSSSK
jgi:hypothetical protein